MHQNKETNHYQNKTKLPPIARVQEMNMKSQNEKKYEAGG